MVNIQHNNTKRSCSGGAKVVFPDKLLQAMTVQCSCELIVQRLLLCFVYFFDDDAVDESDDYNNQDQPCASEHRENARHGHPDFLR